MSPDLLHRIRWANVARAAVVLAAAALVLAWPLLKTDPPTLPPAAAEPVAPAAAEPPADEFRPRGTPLRRRAVRPHRAAGGSDRRRSRPRRHRPAAPAPRPVAAPAPPAPVAPTTAGAREFLPSAP